MGWFRVHGFVASELRGPCKTRSDSLKSEGLGFRVSLSAPKASKALSDFLHATAEAVYKLQSTYIHSSLHANNLYALATMYIRLMI